ncbi:polysaccharide lyase family 8 super-sandwich domain-containing protein [Streptococcus gallinaceus]|uniref:Polysaccharide lyase family 8 central domain-containing protein n=1 Tax=Streptococcus gallinaceus TaxID=165758 RepID=A0ABV2JIS1_9STRE
MSRGRSISRSTGKSHAATIEALRGILRIAHLSNDPRNTKLLSQLKSILQADKVYSPYGNFKSYADIRLMKTLLEDQNISALPVTSWLSTFNNMDKLTYYNAEKSFGFALSLFSSRTQNYEAMNKENVRGWYTSDGMFYLSNADQNHYSENYWPTVDPYKLAGTIETDETRLDATTKNKASSGMGKLPSDFVGSLKLDDKHALAAMDFSNWKKELSLRKGWFILTNRIVFLGAAISNTSGHTASTTIDQRKEDSKHPYTVYINGQKVNLSDKLETISGVQTIFLESDQADRNIAYHFTKPTDLNIGKISRSGAWSDINKNTNQPTTKFSNQFITISQTHTNDKDSYAYTLFPNITKQEAD